MAPNHVTRPVLQNEESIGEKPSVHIEVLIVDDEIEVALALQTMLEELGYVARIATNVGQATKTLRARKPGLLLCDVTMLGPMSGLTWAREARQIYPDLPILLITANALAAEQESEFPLLQKPVASRKLHAAIQTQLALNSGKVVSLFPRPTRRAN
nr:response regulator [Microvirga puerhi]